MKCQNCGKNEATFYYKSNINGRVMESHLCPQCARQLGLVQDMRRPMMSSFWDDDDFFTRPFRMLEPLLGGFGSRLLTEFPEPVDVTQQARRAAGLLGHVHGFRELRQQAAAEAAQQGLQHPEGTGEEIVIVPEAAHHGAAHILHQAQLTGALGAQMALHDPAVDVALIVKRCFVLSAVLTFHNDCLLIENSNQVNQHLLENTGPEIVPPVLGNGAEGIVGHGPQKGLRHVPLHRLGLDQV